MTNSPQMKGSAQYGATAAKRSPTLASVARAVAGVLDRTQQVVQRGAASEYIRIATFDTSAPSTTRGAAALRQSSVTSSLERLRPTVAATTSYGAGAPFSARATSPFHTKSAIVFRLSTRPRRSSSSPHAAVRRRLAPFGNTEFQEGTGPPHPPLRSCVRLASLKPRSQIDSVTRTRIDET
jgi:hypothetical protein